LCQQCSKTDRPSDRPPPATPRLFSPPPDFQNLNFYDLNDWETRGEAGLYFQWIQFHGLSYFDDLDLEHPHSMIRQVTSADICEPFREWTSTELAIFGLASPADLERFKSRAAQFLPSQPLPRIKKCIVLD
jgi:hypothetical protein